MEENIETIEVWHSTNIQRLVYYKDKHELVVTYLHGKGTSMYRYSDVPQTIWDQFLSCKGSYGSLTHKLLKGYKFAKVA